MSRRASIGIASGACVAIVVVCGMSIQRSWSPLKSGTLHSAICSASDWNDAAHAFSGTKQGEFTLYRADNSTLSSFFDRFSIKPVLWGKFNIAERIGRYGAQSPSEISHMISRLREADRPIDGPMWVSNFTKPVDDTVGIFGNFQESSVPWHSYHLDFRLVFKTSESAPYFADGAERGAESDDSSGQVFFVPGIEGDGSAGTFVPECDQRLHFEGRVSGLVIFAKPIADDLVYLLIFDPSPSAN